MYEKLTDAPVHTTGGDQVASRVEFGREDLARMSRQLHNRGLETACPWGLHQVSLKTTTDLFAADTGTYCLYQRAAS